MMLMSVPEHQEPKRASFLQVARAVASAFFGVRRRADHEAVKFSPVHVIIVGLIGAALFVVILLLVVQFVLSRIGTGT